MLVGKSGDLRLPEELRRRWGLAPGAEVLVRETPEGVLLRPSDPPLAKVYVEPTTACNLRCRICVRNSWNEPGGYGDGDIPTTGGRAAGSAVTAYSGLLGVR